MEKFKIHAVLVYLERRKARKLVGKLTYNTETKNYYFQYDKRYLTSGMIPLGPELPLGRKPYVSKELFESFADRIPSKENPAYDEYCHMEGIDPDEKDLFTLLTTIARRGPSSFIFEAQHIDPFTSADLKKFRSELHLTTREFAIAFAISEKTLIMIEKGESLGPEVMKRLEIFVKFPEVALYEFKRNCAAIHVDKIRFVEKILKGKINP